MLFDPADRIGNIARSGELSDTGACSTAEPRRFGHDRPVVDVLSPRE
jgi:hypothetical protein